MVRPTKLYSKVANHVSRYFRGTTYYGLWYKWIEGVNLCGFIDVDFSWSPSNRNNTLGEIFNVVSIVVSSYNSKKRYVVLSSAEAKYMASSQATCEVM